MKPLVATVAVLVALAAGAPVQAQTPELDELRALAEQGDASAQHSLGVIHENGRDLSHYGVVEEVQSHRLAASLGRAAGGVAVGQDCSRGYRWNGSECVRVEVPPNAHIDAFGGGDWEPLVDPEVWERVQTVVSQPDRRNATAETRQSSGKRQYRRVREGFELRGWLRCAVCGGKLTGGTTKGYAYINGRRRAGPAAADRGRAPRDPRAGRTDSVR